MQKTNYTPGPWAVHNNIGRKGEIGITADSAPCIIAIMGNQGKGEWPELARENARLITAAPEMLEACKMALQDFYYLGAKLKSIPVLEAAIKKALGE